MARAGDAGVTLIEILVALALFSLIALAGFTMLDSILRVSNGTDGRLERLAETDRALLVLSRDLQSRGQAEVVADGESLVFERGTSVVAYSLADGGMVRGVGLAEMPQRILEDVERFSVRLLDSSAVWHDDWPPEVEGPIGLSPSLVGVEVTLSLPEGSVTRLIDLPQRVSP